MVLAIALAAAGLGAVALGIHLRSSDRLARDVRVPLAAAAALVLLGCLQCTPLPSSWAMSEARSKVVAVLPDAASPWLPLSLSSPDTVDATVRLAACALIGFAAIVTFRTRRHLVQAAAVIAASGAFQGVYGAAEYFSGHQHIFGYAKKYYLQEATGTFINRNHYAAYLAMTLPFALALALDRPHRRSRARSWRERIVRLAEPESLRALLGAAAAGAIWLGIALSYSRGGLAAALAATAVFAAFSASRRRALVALALVLAIPTGFLLFQDVRAPGERFVEAQEGELASLNSRLPVWSAALRLVPRYPLLGTGLGSFEQAFEPVRPPDITGSWDHAHNDWLQGLVEGGVVGAAAILVLAGAVASAVVKAARSSSGARAVAASLAAIGVACAVDFPLRMPAVAVLLAVVLCSGLRDVNVFEGRPLAVAKDGSQFPGRGINPKRPFGPFQRSDTRD